MDRCNADCFQSELLLSSQIVGKFSIMLIKVTHYIYLDFFRLRTFLNWLVYNVTVSAVHFSSSSLIGYYKILSWVPCVIQ